MRQGSQTGHRGFSGLRRDGMGSLRGLLQEQYVVDALMACVMETAVEGVDAHAGAVNEAELVT